MNDWFTASGPLSETWARSLEKFSEQNLKMLRAALDQATAVQTYWNGIFRYINEFMSPSGNALTYWGPVEKDKLQSLPPWQSVRDYLELLQFNLQLMQKGLDSGLKQMHEYHLRQLNDAFAAWLNTVFDQEGVDIAEFMAQQAQLLDLVVNAYPQTIHAIEAEYGFHFDTGGYVQVGETDHFYLYQVLPWDKQIEVRDQGKPILIIPPYVLGANILAFLPGENKSFVHCFANQGIPTYIRIVKDIDTTPAVQTMTGEDDALDTRLFAEQINSRHGHPLTLCGYCQGGFTAVINLLSGELDGLVDALITCVAPIDGTRSKGLVDFMELLPERFRELGYAVKTLPNGHQVVDGKVMSWVYKLKSMNEENPITAFYRDLKLLEKGMKIRKTAAAINYWLLYDKTDLPLEIIKMSYDSYNIPVTPDGTLPVKLFGRSLNFKRLKDQGIKWLICCAEKDDLVEKEAALAPLDWVEAEVTMFPKGHAAIATSWSLPTSECAFHTCFTDGCRGPVRYHLDLEAVLEPPAPKKPPRAVSKVKQKIKEIK
ncbi:MAG: metal transporter [Desulfobacteraceae bacterium]